MMTHQVYVALDLPREPESTLTGEQENAEDICTCVAHSLSYLHDWSGFAPSPKAGAENAQGRIAHRGQAP